MFAVMYNNGGTWVPCYTHGGWAGAFSMPSVFTDNSSAELELLDWQKKYPDGEYKIIEVSFQEVRKA